MEKIKFEQLKTMKPAEVKKLSFEQLTEAEMENFSAAEIIDLFSDEVQFEIVNFVTSKMTIDKIRSTTPNIGAVRRGKNYDLLTNEQKLTLRKLMEKNNKFAILLQTGKLKKVRFHVIDDTASETQFTPFVSIGTKFTYKDGTTWEAVAYKRQGTNDKLTLTVNGKPLTIPVSGMTIENSAGKTRNFNNVVKIED